MTGFGRAEITREGITVSAEARSVNSRFLEVFTRLPRSLIHRENDLREIVRGRLARGKVTIAVTLQNESNGATPLAVNAEAARAYYKLLNDLRKTVKLREQVRLEHLLTFSEVLQSTEVEETDEKRWTIATQAVRDAIDAMNTMRRNEGSELAKDLKQRIQWINSAIDDVEKKSHDRIPQERERIQERLAEILGDTNLIDQNRLEMEISLLADKLDITEECVRFRSHNKFFLETLNAGESAGRKLGFLIQEMNRETNTIGSKSSDAEIAHRVVQVKEELEKVREQLQNIE